MNSTLSPLPTKSEPQTLVGHAVTIPAGTRVFSTYPKSSPTGIVASRARVVTVASVIEGYENSDYDVDRYGVAKHYPTTVRWAGMGGYWNWCDIAAVEVSDTTSEDGGVCVGQVYRETNNKATNRRFVIRGLFTGADGKRYAEVTNKLGRRTAIKIERLLGCRYKLVRDAESA